jgi:hypothetical protein
MGSPQAVRVCRAPYSKRYQVARALLSAASATGTSEIKRTIRFLGQAIDELLLLRSELEEASR